MFPYQPEFNAENQNMPAHYWGHQYSYYQNQHLAPYQEAHSYTSYNYNNRDYTGNATIGHNVKLNEFQNHYGIQSSTPDVNLIQENVNKPYEVIKHESNVDLKSEYAECQDQKPVIDYGYHYGVSSTSKCQPIQYPHPLTPEPVSYPVFEMPKSNQNCNVMAKKHRAQISLVPTDTGNFKAIVKRKRKRTVFTTQQIESLDNIFKTRQYITREDRQVIVKDLQLNDKSVKIWFQNRRLKGKKLAELQVSESTDERSSPDSNRLDNVECQLSENTNEYGYVTLNDGVMENLVNVIDDFLTTNKTDDAAENITQSKTNCYNIYEPISPASISDSSEVNSPSWKPVETNESLQRLLDLQTMLSL